MAAGRILTSVPRDTLPSCSTEVCRSTRSGGRDPSNSRGHEGQPHRQIVERGQVPHARADKRRLRDDASTKGDPLLGIEDKDPIALDGGVEELH